MIKEKLRKVYEKAFGVFVYGHERTIHGTGTIDVQLDRSGRIIRVWFRCLELPWRVSYEGSGQDLYSDLNHKKIRAIEVEEDGA